MEWVTCPKCGFTQIPSEKCLRCERMLERQDSPPRNSEPAPVPARPRPRLISRTPGVVAAVVLLAALAGFFLWKSRGAGSRASAKGAPTAVPAPPALNLEGQWQSQASELLPTSPPRPAVKDVYIQTDRRGNIIAAGVLLTDPGHGGAGAGYRVVADGRPILSIILPLLAAEPSGAALPIDFGPFPPWMPARTRIWRPLEGQRRRQEEVRYLLLESVEDDYLVQAGINQTGFLSYAFFSPEYASGRGLDTLSKVIHPEPGSSLRGFRNLVWDLSGAADFLKLEVSASVSGPEGVASRLLLKRRT
jgi:hypothetical protein